MGATVVVGIGAGIAAYKVAPIVRGLQRDGHEVVVVPTPASLRFVGVATWEALTGRPVHSGVFEAGGADHVEIAREADLVVLAPATADLLARLRAGMADDLLTTTVLAATCPVLVVPAMHTAMWQNPATRDNIATLRARGLHVMEPASGALSSGDSGVGRLPEPEEVLSEIRTRLRRPAGDLSGRRVLVTAGGTHEPVDPVRFLGNHSSGRQGAAIARQARDRGAAVTLVAANVEPGLVPDGVEVVAVTSAQDMADAVAPLLASTDVLVMAAAVADFRPVRVHARKIKKDPDDDSVPVLALERTPDILAAATRSPDRPRVVVGFGAETGTPEEVARLGREKARRKGADLLAVNVVGAGRGFGDVDNTLHLLDGAGREVAVLRGSKDELARGLLDEVVQALGTMAG